MKKIISNNLRIKIQTVLFITIAWILVGILNVYYNHLIVLSQEAFEFNDYDLGTALITSSVALFVAGLGGGSIIIFFLKDRLRKLPLGMVIIINAITFIVIIAIVSVLGFMFYYWLFAGESYFDGDLWFNLSQFITSYGFVLNLIVWTLVATATMVILQVNDKYGRGVFLESLLGKYHNPINEERIFMFLDLKSSTTIAEELGHKQYFKLLNRFFEDVTHGVIENKGDIYQYVGDEIVITWPLKEGLENSNCIRCFFEIERIINKKAHKYQEKYQLTPTFKAAIHGGEVTTGEVGTFKKDIIFTGDVLNTTSRIEDKCNEFGAKLLVSQDLISQLDLNEEFKAKELGDVELRGKHRPVKVFTIAREFIEEEQLEVDQV